MNYRDLFDCSHSLAGKFIASFAYPWQALPPLKEFILALGRTLGCDYAMAGEGVWLHRTACVASTACITGPCIVGACTQLRHGAFLRGGVLVGDNCVVGNSTELKNCVLFDCVQVPHFNYVGDSILGYRAHLGAGVIVSNVRLDKRPVSVHGEETLNTGLKKFGALVGDCSEVGCNSVLNPGTVLCPNARIPSLTSVRGIV